VVLVAGVDDALLAIGEGELLLLEPERSRVIAEPSALEVARLQAKHQPRILLDEPNFPAFTTEGIKITVWGMASTLDEARAALAAGADGLLLRDGAWDEDALWAAQELVGGGDLALALPFETLDPELVVRLAARSTLRWCLDPETLPLPIETLRTELTELVSELEEENQRAALPKLAAQNTWEAGYDELIVLEGELPDPDPETPLWEQPPLYGRVEALFGQLLGLEDALERGVAGVIVAPDTLAEVKEKIRAWG
jgi:hypothetical protein